MEIPQATIGEILESEHQMVLMAPDRYGAYYRNAVECSVLLTHFLKSIDLARSVFCRFLSQAKKHHTLALFSVVRRHQVQATMNLRQTIEASVLAAYAIRHPELEHFVQQDKHGLLSHPPKLSRKAYDWMDATFPGHSRRIKEVKDHINAWTAHANLITTDGTFAMQEGARWMATPFFDREDEHFVRVDLWRLGHTALTILDLFRQANSGVDGVVFADDYRASFVRLLEENKRLYQEIAASDWFKRARAAAARRAA
jgi:hypothetical protein